MELRVHVEIQSNTIDETPLPEGVLCGYLLHDYEVYGVSRPTRVGTAVRIMGLPETIKVLEPRFMPMTEEWQWYWVDLFALSKYNRLYEDCNSSEQQILRKAFAGATVGWRAVTNKKGWDSGYQDYVNDVNPGAEPMGQETINFGGNIVELLNNGEPIRKGGADVYIVRTLDGRQPPPDPMVVNYKTSPHLVFCGTVSRREGYDVPTQTWAREDIVIPWPQLGGANVTIPFMGYRDFNYIRVERIRKLEDGDTLPPVYHYSARD